MATNFQLNVKAIVDSVDLQEQIKKIKIDPIKIQVDLGGTSDSKNGFAGVSGVAKSFNAASESAAEFRGKLVDTYKIAADGSREQVSQMQTVQNGYNSQIQTLLELNKETKELLPVQQRIATDTAAGTNEIVRQGQAWKNLDAELKSNYLKDLEYEGATLKKNAEENRKYQAELSRQGQAWKNLDAQQIKAQDSADALHSKYQKSIDQDYAKYIEKQAMEEQKLSNQEAILRKQFDDRVASNAAGIQTLKVRMTGLTDEQLRFVNAGERLNEIQSMTNVDQQAKAIRSLTADMNAASRGTNTFAATLQYMTERFVQIGIYVAIFRKLKSAISDMVETVSSLDSSLVKLRKVTDLSDSQLKSFTKSAFEAGETLARTGREVVDATTVFSRAGYDIQEAFDLGKSALLLVNTADGINDVADASGTLISVLKAFNMKATESTHIVDALNEVSNNYAIDTNNLADILQRVSGTLGQTGTTMEEVFGLAVGGYTTLRNAEMVASGLNMISQRMRGMKEDGEEIGGLVPKIESALQEYTNGAVTMWDKQTGELRSTYDVLNDLAKVYPSLSSAQKAYLNEVIAGDDTTLYVQKCA